MDTVVMENIFYGMRYIIDCWNLDARPTLMGTKTYTKMDQIRFFIRD